MGMGEVSAGGVQNIQCSMGSKGDYEQSSSPITGTLDNCIDLPQKRGSLAEAPMLDNNLSEGSDAGRE